MRYIFFSPFHKISILMKKVLFSVLAVCACVTVFAQQRMAPGTTRPAPSLTRMHSRTAPISDRRPAPSAKIIMDTLALYNNYDSLLFQSSAVYKYGILHDSGFVFGMNAYSDNEFAEYFYTGFGGDTSVEIIGVYSAWAGVA